MTILFTFILGILVSYIASIPIGAVNMAVVQATLNHSPKAGYMVGIGAIITEAIYCGIPLFGLNFYLDASGIMDIMYVVFIPVMVFLGIYSIVNRETSLKTKDDSAKMGNTYGNNILYGAMLCGTNPMTLVFWTQITVFLKGQEYLKAEWPILTAFLMGVPLGSFLLYVTFVKITQRTGKKMSDKVKAKINVVIGVIFICLAVYLTITFLTKEATDDKVTPTTEELTIPAAERGNSADTAFPLPA